MSRAELQSIRDLFDDPKRFTTGTFARDSDGVPCAPKSEGAVCWCLLGAIRKLEQDWRPGTSAYRLITEGVGEMPIAPWADAHGYVAVIALLDRLLLEPEAA